MKAVLQSLLSKPSTFFLLVSLCAGISAPASDFAIPETGRRPARGRHNPPLCLVPEAMGKQKKRLAKDVEKKQGALVFLGDSITQGLCRNEGNSFPGVKVANRGISGDTTRGVLIRLEEDVLSLRPSGIVLLIGTNDLEEKAEPAVIASNVKQIVNALKQHNCRMPVILCQVMPSSETKRRPAEKIRQINRLVFAQVKGDPQITVLDTWTLFANEQGDAKKPEFPDLLHPNKTGYAKWAAALRPLLATHGFIEKTKPAFEIEAGYEMLFNGNDLTGWGYREKKTLDLFPPISMGKPKVTTGVTVPSMADWLSLPQLKAGGSTTFTTREFPKISPLKLEFRATPNADSGVFIRKPQLQCRDYVLAGVERLGKVQAPGME